MASLAMTSAGSSIAIGLPAASDTLAAFQAVSYTVINEITDLSSFGKVYNQVTHNPLATRQTIKRKGSYDNGTISLQMAYAPSDAGQTMLTAAVNSDDSYSYRVTLQDGTIFYFGAQAMSRTVEIGGVDSITASTCDLEIDTEVHQA